MPQPQNVAAVDLGSHSFHLIVARHPSGQLVVVDRIREMVQLAAGLDENQCLDAGAIERALDCLRRFGQRLHHMPVRTVRAVGTNTLRSARNAPDFLRRAEEALGHPIETIAGMEEARLIYLGVAHSLANPAARRLVVDIGGGSTEVIVGEGFLPIRMESLYIGCVTASRQFFREGGISPSRWRKAEVAALREFEPLRSGFNRIGWEQAVGASGTVRSIEAVNRAEGWTPAGITLKSLKRLRDVLLKAGHSDRVRLRGLNPARRPVFAAGAAVLMAAFEAMKIESMQYAEGALREGLLYDILGRIGEEDVRVRSVNALGERFHIDKEQAARVETTTRRLLQQVAADWNLKSADVGRLLAWASRLHEIGLDVAHGHYHKHGEYIISESDLSGFSRDEQKVLGALVRAHRRRFPQAAIRSLPRSRSRMVERLAILLRLAVILHRSRGPESIPRLRLQAGKKSLQIEFPGGWLERHPLTRADLELERDYLAAAGLRLQFS